MIAAGSAVLLLIVMFVFNWFSLGGDEGEAASSLGFDTGVNAWQAFSWIDIFLFITILAAIGLAVIAASTQSVNVPVAPSAIVTVLGGISVLLLVFRIISPPGGGDAPAGFDVTISRGIGVFLGLLLTIGIAAGAWMAMQEEGVSFQGEADRFGGGGAAPPPPPPPPSA